jgi:hypothetical protein
VTSGARAFALPLHGPYSVGQRFLLRQVAFRGAGRLNLTKGALVHCLAKMAWAASNGLIPSTWSMSSSHTFMNFRTASTKEVLTLSSPVPSSVAASVTIFAACCVMLSAAIACCRIAS